jgi:hypothetical protein
MRRDAIESAKPPPQRSISAIPPRSRARSVRTEPIVLAVLPVGARRSGSGSRRASPRIRGARPGPILPATARTWIVRSPRTGLDDLAPTQSALYLFGIPTMHFCTSASTPRSADHFASATEHNNAAPRAGERHSPRSSAALASPRTSAPAAHAPRSVAGRLRRGSGGRRIRASLRGCHGHDCRYACTLLTKTSVGSRRGDLPIGRLAVSCPQLARDRRRCGSHLVRLGRASGG